jgi:hypothetical protein
MDRRTFWATVGFGLMTVAVAILLGYKAAGFPHATVIVAGLMLAAGFVFVGAAIAGAPPARPDIDPNHSASLREIAERLPGDGEMYNSTAERQMFEAHYRGVVRLRSVADESRLAEAHAWDRLIYAVGESMDTRFSEDDFWRPGDLFGLALARLQGRRKHVKLSSGAVVCGRPKISDQPPLPQVAFDQHVVWWPIRDSPEANMTDDELAARAEALRAWFDEIQDLEPARIYRRSLQDVLSNIEALETRVEPIRYHERIEWSRRCFICRPKRRWQIWR